ncbi:MAG TPA: cytochrome c oxidase assembly protein [Deinococcales bacterium]|nr:cytochrome c oxidase assembly protein [Deinococcales bacterium]
MGRFWKYAPALGAAFTAQAFSLASAHGLAAPGGPWRPDWLLVSNVLVVMAAFVGLNAWLQARHPARAPGRRRVGLWLAGMLVAGLATASPLDALADQLFSLHMTQHTLLVLLAAPLLAYAVPDSWLPAWPAGNPVDSWFLATGVFAAWHFPILYLAALNSEAIHAVEHLSMLVTAMAFWWAFRRLEGAGGVLYLFTSMLAGSALGALFTFSNVLWYPVYDVTAPAFGLSGLQDQQLAGLVMWSPGSLVYLLVAAVSFNAWLLADRPVGTWTASGRPLESRPVPLPLDAPRRARGGRP